MKNLLHAHDESLARRLAAATASPGRERRGHADGVLFGHDSAGREVRVSWAALHRHLAIFGRSGAGKSNLLLFVIFQLLRNGNSVVVLDGKGDLAEAAVSIGILVGLRPADVVVVNPADTSAVVCVDPLDPGEAGCEAHARVVLSNLRRLLNETENTTRVWLELYGNSAIASLIAAGASLTHLGPFLSISQPGFREAVLDLAADSIGDPEHYSRWSDLSLLRESEAVLRVAPLMTRAGIISSSSALRNLYGGATRVPWGRFFGPPRSRPQLLVAPLGRSGHLAESEGRAAGLSIMHAITNLAWQRRLVPETRRQRIFVVSDESERFIDRIVADGHEKLRSLGVHFISSFQMLSQLEKTGDPYIATSVIANTSTKIAFATSSADADLLATEMFASQYDPLRRKHETWGTKFRPIEETRTTVARSRGSSSSWTKTDTDAVGSGHGEGRGGTTPYGAVHESSNSRNRSESYSRTTSASSGESGSTSESVTETVSPFIAHAEFKELGAVSFHGPDDQHAEAMAAIMRQGTGECVVATLGGKPVSIRVPRMRELPVSNRELRSFLSASRALYAMPVADIQRSAQDRMDAIFKEAVSRRAIQRPVRGQLTDGASVQSGGEMDRHSGRDVQSSRRPAPVPSVADADVIEDLGAPFGLGEEKSA